MVRREQALIQRAALRSAESVITGYDPAQAEQPRRFGGAAVGSVIIAVVALTIVAATALLSGHHGPAAVAAGPVTAPASAPTASSGPLSTAPSAPPSPVPPSASASALAAWQHSGILIVDDVTGKSYVYASGRLRPPANPVSADLILGTPSPRRVTIAHATIVAAHPGPEIGVTGAPTLPMAGAMLGGDLVICSVSGQSSASIAVPSAAGGVDPTGYIGYAGLSGGNGLSTNSLVVSNRGADYLVWNRVRYPISDPAKVFAAYKWTGVVAAAVPDDVLAALPRGATISPTALSLKPPKPLHLGPPGTFCVSVARSGAATHTMVNPTVTVGAGTFTLPTTGAMLLKASASATTVDLVLPSGTYYPISGGKAALASLGYQAAAVSIVPSSVLSLLKLGPTLSRQAALAS